MDEQQDVNDTLENLPLIITDINDLEEDPDFDVFLPSDWVPMEFAHICAKTAASQKFISDAKIYLTNDPNNIHAKEIKQQVRKLREMEVQLSEWTTVEDFISSLSDNPDMNPALDLELPF